MDRDVDAPCKYCDYPGEGSVFCPECGAKIETVVVEYWSDGTTVHCSACREPIDHVLDDQASACSAV